jgi:aarF domain-containing kinase
MRWRRAFIALAMPMTAYTAYDYLTPEQLLIRNLRTLSCGVKILINYKLRYTPENMNQIHEESARTIYELCLANDGLYVKIG